MIDKSYGKFYTTCDDAEKSLTRLIHSTRLRAKQMLKVGKLKGWEQTGLTCARLAQRRCKICCL